jgi:hypothetical protein
MSPPASSGRNDLANGLVPFHCAAERGADGAGLAQHGDAHHRCERRPCLNKGAMPMLPDNACFQFPLDSPALIPQNIFMPRQRRIESERGQWRKTNEKRFLDVFSGIASDVGDAAIGFPNPNGIASFSPRLRGTSYPGQEDREITTLKELNLFQGVAKGSWKGSRRSRSVG